MKLMPVLIAMAVLLSRAGVGLAGPDIPDLRGTWEVKGEGGMLLKGDVPGEKTHHRSEFSTIAAEVAITNQQGRVLHGTFKSQRATERFVAVIGIDNKSFHYADEDGFIEGEIVDKDRINIVYRHVTARDIVVATGVWTRKKQGQD